jgi:flavin-dependent dehydrogenase
MVATREQPADAYDVAILGGGLAGLTLGLQLKRARPETTVFIAEKRAGPAPEAAFKVGESTVELSSNYVGEVVGMKDHLERDQIHKCGLRFFLPAGDNTDIAERVEVGPPLYPPVPSYQLDRGRFENEAARRNLEAGVDLFQGAFVDDVEVGSRDRPHAVTIVRGGPGGERTRIESRWLVDASGRAFLLKRKLGLEEENGHVVHSSWFRLAGGLDIEEWVRDDDEEWFGRMKERGLRRFSTNHLCGEGYWVWLIPLSSGPISIGIVADPRFHPWERINTLEGSLDWIREYEPQLAAALDGRRDQVEDFLKIPDFSHGCKQVFSADRWCLTGESGAFLDPFYSPGSDYIAMANTFVTDLVLRDLDGEDVGERAEAHNDLYLSAYETHLTFYEGQYVFWGNSQIMGAKIAVNNILYWGANALLFFHRKLTDLDFMAAVRPDVERIWSLNRRLEELFRQWHALESREWRRGNVGVTDFPALIQLHVQLAAGFDDETLKAKLRANANLLEAVAVLVFTKAASALGDAAPSEDEKVNPYAVSLEPDRWEADGLFADKGLSAAEARQTPAGGLDSLWMEVVAQPAYTPR